MKTLSRGTGTIGLTLAFALMASTQAGAAELGADETAAEDAATVFAEAAPALDAGASSVDAAAAGDGTFTAPVGEGDFAAPADGAGELVLGGGDLTIALPPESSAADGVVTDDGSLVYPADESGTSSVVEPLVGGVRIATVLEDADAPTSYTYQFDGARPELQGDGSVLLYADEVTVGEDPAAAVPAGTVESPWATDANGQPVATHYEVVGDSVIQVIEPTATTAYPVVADPTAWWGVYYKMSSTAANRISAALYAGSGVAALASILIATGVVTAPGAVATGIAAAVLTIGAAVISYCNAAGRGIVVAKPWVTPPYCYSR